MVSAKSKPEVTTISRLVLNYMLSPVSYPLAHVDKCIDCDEGTALGKPSVNVFRSDLAIWRAAKAIYERFTDVLKDAI